MVLFLEALSINCLITDGLVGVAIKRTETGIVALSPACSIVTSSIIPVDKLAATLAISLALLPIPSNPDLYSSASVGSALSMYSSEIASVLICLLKRGRPT